MRGGIASESALRYRRGRLWAEGIPLERIAREVGTPAYVYSARSIRERFEAVDGAFRGRDHLVCYALKANSNRSVCRLLAGLGAGADIVSGGELRRALAAGFPPRAIVFSGVGKTREEIEEALRRGVLALNVESEEELSTVAAAARRLGRRAPIAVRLNPDVDAGTHRHITTGRSENKFGSDLPRALAMYRRVRRDGRLKAVGVQTHIGSQITRVHPYRRALEATLRLVSRLAREGISLDYIDIGGGMGITYRDEEPLPLEELAREVAAQLRPWPRLRLLLEPGRYLTADAGLLLTRVLYRKSASRTRFVVVDAAMNDLLRPALYDAYHPIAPVRWPARRSVRVDVVGPVCETADCFARKRPMPWPSLGEVWAVLKAGAYGFSMSSQYNSRPRPAEVLVDGRSFTIVRGRETFRDLVRHER